MCIRDRRGLGDRYGGAALLFIERGEVGERGLRTAQCDRSKLGIDCDHLQGGTGLGCELAQALDKTGQSECGQVETGGTLRCQG